MLSVSIRAPARDATSPRQGLSFRELFRSARPRGTRRRCAASFLSVVRFDPRARAGRDSRMTRLSSIDSGFDPRARAGRDIPASRVRQADTCFDPRARAGRDQWSRCPLCRHQGFDPRARAGRDAAPGRGYQANTSIGPRARAGRDANSLGVLLCLRMFRSARPRGTRRLLEIRLRRDRLVSIRAPARDATSDGRRDAEQVDVSIRAPARDATCTLPSVPSVTPVSIRAPARDATVVVVGRVGMRVVSIRAPARDATTSVPGRHSPIRFRSARPRGTRLAWPDHHRLRLVVSIRAPARDATCVDRELAADLRVSIRAPARDATRLGIRSC